MVDGGMVVVEGPLYLVWRREIREGRGRCLMEVGGGNQRIVGLILGEDR